MTEEATDARQALTVADLEAWVRRSAELITEHAEELTALDAAIGDADHGTNMKRGLAAAVDAVEAGGFTAADALLKKVGMTLVSTVGGASGPLYGTFFLRTGGALSGQDSIDAPALAAGAGTRCDTLVPCARKPSREPTAPAPSSPPIPSSTTSTP